MSRPDDPGGQESIWARLEREDREDAKRTRGPLVLTLGGVSLVNLANLARVNQVLTGAAFWFVVCIAVGLAVAGLVLAWSRRRRS